MLFKTRQTLSSLSPEKADQLRLDFEEYVIDIVEKISQDLGSVLDASTTRWVSRPAGKEHIKDATLAFFVDGHRYRDDIALLISNPSFTDAVADDVSRSRDVALLVGQEVGKHIVSPVCQGVYNKQTYAAFSRLSPVSSYRVARLFQKRMVSGRVVSWLESLAIETRESRSAQSEYSQYFCQPLEIICGDREMPQEIRAFADLCGVFVSKNQPDLFTVVEHGDFWIGNVLFQRRFIPDLNPLLGEFSVIDWRGSRTDGYPCIDLVRFCSSIFRNGSSKTDSLISSYIGGLQISKFEMSIYCILSLGRLRADLDQFPKDRFYFLCERVFEFLQAHSLTAAD